VGYKFGQWHDVGWWQLALQPRVVEPAARVLLSDAVRMDGWEEAVNAGLCYLK
jgi:hypothetical protein